MIKDLIDLFSLLHSQMPNKLSSNTDGKQVHIHLTEENLRGCFLNFGSADVS
jgi:hypothetical protein